MEYLSNIKYLKLMDKCSGELLKGKIKLCSNRGYPSRVFKPQQDAVGSLVKSDDCYINVVADGIGGCPCGEIASAQIVTELLNWFKELDVETINDTEQVELLLVEQIRRINRHIFVTNDNTALTTFVLALTNNAHTIIANVGDSTAYTYNSDIEELELLSKVDSWSYNRFYEERRYDPYNNVVMAYIGDGFDNLIHINVIDNNGQRIILSTDGVTDLVNEETFISYFTSDVSAQKIVNDAIYHPNVENLAKKEDNVSVIIIDLPAHQKQLKKQ